MPRLLLLSLCVGSLLACSGVLSGEFDALPGHDGSVLQDASVLRDGGSRPPILPPELPDGPLAGLPSEPGPHIADIEALGDGEWLALGAPTADPRFGVGFGRAWGGRALISAPELRGAFFFGEGIHGYVKPDGYAMDDVFFYDIQQHRWIAVYPGMHIASFNDRVREGGLRIDEHRQVIDENGHHLPIHTLIHAWDFMTYDTTRHRFAWIAGDGMDRYYLPGGSQMEEGLVTLEAQRQAAGSSVMSPWYYDTTTGAFLREVIETPRADVGSFSAFVYLPEQDRYFNGGNSGVQFFDPTTNRWSRVADSGPRPPSHDHGVAYDWRRGRIYMGTGDPSIKEGLFIYDLATSTWSHPSTTGGPRSFRTNDASAMYDDANDVLTIFQYSQRRIYTYEPDIERWSSVEMPDEITGARQASFHGFYDAEMNAYFIYRANDSESNGLMWAYRYRRPR